MTHDERLEQRAFYMARVTAHYDTPRLRREARRKFNKEFPCTCPECSKPFIEKLFEWPAKLLGNFLEKICK